MKNSTRVILNTGILYTRMAITMCIALLSTRWILQALGTEDYGIYSLTGGVIALFSFLNVSLAGATQRFISYSIGTGEKENIKKTFYYSILQHLCVGIIIILLFETCGLFFLNTILDIPTGKERLATFVLHCMTASAFFTIISVPYQAILNAHENMLLNAILNIIESIIKLIAAIVLLKYNGNRLELYSIIMMLTCIMNLIVMRIYCKQKYIETQISITQITDKHLFIKMLSFGGWNLIGSICSMSKGQGIAILLNTFYGVTINTAYGIANQVKGQLNFFSLSITSAIRPQMIKSEGAGDRDRLLRLAETTCKCTFILLSIFAIPVIINTNFILLLWLKNVPQYTVSFCQYIILMALIEQLSSGLFIVIDGVGKLKWPQLTIGFMHLSVLIGGYIFLYWGYPPYSIFIVATIEEIIAFILRCHFCNKLGKMDIMSFLKSTISPSVISICTICAITLYISNIISSPVISFFTTTILSTILICLCTYNIILNDNERIIIKQTLTKKLQR